MEKDQADHAPHEDTVRLAFRVSYLGSRFFGSQVQAEERTVEGEVIAACLRLRLFANGKEAGFLSAGRTDRGVHATGQIVAFSTKVPDRAIAAINTQLPLDIWCTGFARVPKEFHPRYDAMSRTYRYYFPEGFPQLSEMKQAAESFPGCHNFTNFARVGDKNPWRTILAISIGEEDGFVFLEVTAESFLWHQVRCMASALSLVGRGEAPAELIRELLESVAKRPLQPAPAEGLVLWNTDCGISWTQMPATDRHTTRMDQLIQHYRLMGKVASAMRDVRLGFPGN